MSAERQPPWLLFDEALKERTVACDEVAVACDIALKKGAVAFDEVAVACDAGEGSCL